MARPTSSGRRPGPLAEASATRQGPHGHRHPAAAQRRPRRATSQASAPSSRSARPTTTDGRWRDEGGGSTPVGRLGPAPSSGGDVPSDGSSSTASVRRPPERRRRQLDARRGIGARRRSPRPRSGSTRRRRPWRRRRPAPRHRPRTPWAASRPRCRPMPPVSDLRPGDRRRMAKAAAGAMGLDESSTLGESAHRLAEELTRIPGIERFGGTRLRDLDRSGPRSLRVLWGAAREELSSRYGDVTIGMLLDAYTKQVGGPAPGARLARSGIAKGGRGAVPRSCRTPGSTGASPARSRPPWRMFSARSSARLGERRGRRSPSPPGR